VGDKNTNLFWVDLEMTGLDPNKDVILEIGSLVTDSDLNVLAEGPEILIHQDESKFHEVDKNVRELFLKSGLPQKVKESIHTLDMAEQKTLEFAQKYIEPGVSPYCGNTVATDKQFIKKYMPALANFLHYRTIDVSTIKELAKRWYPDLPLFVKAEHHRAMDDIKESVAELKYYRENIFIKQI
jgi:oligoribonuclease